MKHNANLEAWTNILPEDIREHLYRTDEKVNAMRQGSVIYPPEDKVYAALEAVKPEEVKVVILGQDPYHDEGQANGLAFSVENGVKFPPSLRNIFKELQADLGQPIPDSGDLTAWAKQGVLLLNTALTVEAHKPGSHEELGWNKVTGAIIDWLITSDNPVVFVAWGKFAYDTIFGATEKAKEEGKERTNKAYIASTHPSPFSASRSASYAGAFLGSKPFSKVNEALKNFGIEPINW